MSEDKYRVLSTMIFQRQKKCKVVVGEKLLNPKTNRYKTIKHVVYIEPCYESYQQYGAPTDVLWFTLPIAEKLVELDFTYYSITDFWTS